MQMKPLILIDKNLAEAGGGDLFSPHGAPVETVETVDFPPHLLAKADALIIRTQTKIDAALLRHAPRLSFVGSASAGFDHVNLPALRARSVRFAYAPGSNAFAVVDYVLSALAATDKLADLLQGRLSLGVIGFGHIGRHLVVRLRSLADILQWQPRILVYDPILKPAEAKKYQSAFGVELASLNRTLSADCISLHCSLTRDHLGSAGMIDTDILRSLKKHQMLINTARASVLADSIGITADADADKKHKKDKNYREQVTKATLVFDVWHKQTSQSLVRLCFAATPHIAGYSLEAKQRALRTVYEDFCRHFHLAVKEKKQPADNPRVPPPRCPKPLTDETVMSYIKRLLLINYDIVRDSLGTKRAVNRESRDSRDPPVKTLTRLRNIYTLRQRIVVSPGQDNDTPPHSACAKALFEY